MSVRIRSTLLRLSAFALTLFVLSQVLDLDKLLEGMRRLSPGILALCAALEFGIVAIETLRLRRLAGFALPFGALWRARLLSLLVGTFLPGLAAAELVRYAALRRNSYDPLRLALLLLANRLYGVVALAGVLLVGLIPQMGSAAAVAGGGLCAVALLTPLLLRVGRLRVFLARTLRRLHGRVRRAARRTYLAATGFSHPRQWAAATTSSFATNMLSVVQFWLLGRELGVAIGLSGWALVVPWVSIATFLPIGLGAVGPQDASLVAIARLVGQSTEAFASISVGVHLLRLPIALAGLFYLGWLRRPQGDARAESVA